MINQDVVTADFDIDVVGVDGKGCLWALEGYLEHIFSYYDERYLLSLYIRL